MIVSLKRALDEARALMLSGAMSKGAYGELERLALATGGPSPTFGAEPSLSQVVAKTLRAWHAAWLERGVEMPPLEVPKELADE